jgi:hypothetical protein
MVEQGPPTTSEGGFGMRFIMGLLRFALRTAVLLLALALGYVGLTTLGGDLGGPRPPVTLGGAVLLLVVWWRLRRRHRRVRPVGGAEAVPATIMRIWQDPRPGAPGIYWTYVLFDVRGERVTVHLSKAQAKDFLGRHGEGDVGRLAWDGDKMVAWEPATAQQPVGAPGVTAFLSYERTWGDDARYVAEFLRSRGHEVWMDVDELPAGSQLGRGVERAIAKADVFVPLLSQSYWTSAWCLRELEEAHRRGKPIRPVKPEAGRLSPPPHMVETAAAIQDAAVYLDLRGRNPITELENFAEQLRAVR